MISKVPAGIGGRKGGIELAAFSAPRKSQNLDHFPVLKMMKPVTRVRACRTCLFVIDRWTKRQVQLASRNAKRDRHVQPNKTLKPSAEPGFARA